MKFKIFKLVANAIILLSSSLVLAAECRTQKFRIGSMRLAFLSVVDAKRVIVTADDFTKRLNSLNRALRLMVNRDVSYKEYFDFVQSTTLCWTQEEIREILQSAQGLESRMRQINSQGFRLDVLFVKNNGKDEGGAYYTRGNYVSVPKGKISTSTLAHEFFHIFTRTHSNLKDRIYSVAGFHPRKISVPEAYANKLIINPDAPKMEHAIWVNYKNQPLEVVPLILSKVQLQQIDPRKPNFFSYVSLTLMSLSNFKLIPIDQTDYFQKTGGNTNYIIHPEEILADNFAALITQAQVPNQAPLESLRKLLRQRRMLQ